MKNIKFIHRFYNKILDNAVVDLEEKVHLSLVGNITSFAYNMAKGSSITVGLGTQRGGFTIFPSGSQKTSTIRGSITVNKSMTAGTGSFHADRYLFSIGDTREYGPNVILGEGASIKQNGVFGAYNDFTRAINRVVGGASAGAVLSVGLAQGGVMESVAEGALVFDDFLYFVNTTTLKLHSKNALISGAAVENIAANKEAGFKNATSQATSTIFVGRATSMSSFGTGGNFTLNSFVANELGTINATSDSTIKLISEALKEGESFVLHNLEITPDANGNKTLDLLLNFNEDISPNMQIENFYELYDDEDTTLTIQIYDHSKGKYVDGVLNGNFAVSQDGWISAVPEPSTYAMIFGAIALGFVAYRRAKVRGRA